MPKTENGGKTYRKAAVAVVRDKDGKFIVMKHLKYQLLSFCIGKCEENETPYHCLCREAFEELGINVISVRLVTKYTKTYHFTGEPVEYENYVYDIVKYDGTAFNREPHKCGGLISMSKEDLLNIIKEENVADCIKEYFKN